MLAFLQSERRDFQAAFDVLVVGTLVTYSSYGIGY